MQMNPNCRVCRVLKEYNADAALARGREVYITWRSMTGTCGDCGAPYIYYDLQMQYVGTKQQFTGRTFEVAHKFVVSAPCAECGYNPPKMAVCGENSDRTLDEEVELVQALFADPVKQELLLPAEVANAQNNT